MARSTFEVKSTETIKVTPINRRRRGGEDTAERILDEAEALFAERGFAGTTLRHVAEAVGVRNPSLYNHFSSKEALYNAVLERGIQPVLDVLAEFIEERKGGTETSSNEILERVVRLLAERPYLPRLVQHETLMGGQRLTPMLRDWIATMFAKAYEVMESTPVSERWRADQVSNFVLAMYHIILGYFTIAPLYAELGGEDLLSNEALDRQIEFMQQMIDSLLFDDKAQAILA